VPGDRHAVLVAEALPPFLPPAEVLALIRRLIEPFPGGDLVLNGAQRVAKFAPALKVSSRWTVPPVHRSARARNPAPRLKLVEEVLRARDFDRFPFLLRVLSRPFARTPGLARFGARVLHCRF
jgi:O-methyltransferase involved in polyketide biosynthesis